jgi:hypothetical protein
MSRSILGMIKGFGENVRAVAGEKVQAEVMEGRAGLTARAKPVAAARWMKGAIDRLDRLTDKKTRAEIMTRCGRACLRVNAAFVSGIKARRKKFASEDEFLAAEVKKPLTGTRLERRGKFLYHTYTPRTFGRSRRCYCALAGALPDAENMSPTHCLCSKAFLQGYWEAALGRPLGISVLETALSGARECRFRIDLGHGSRGE